MWPGAGQMEGLVVVNPLEHGEWNAWVAGHPDGKCFHSSGWARVLHETYGHRPVYFCRFNGGELLEMIPVMEVCSALTGRRGVSLPFSDLCPPLTRRGHSAQGLYEFALDYGNRCRWRYLECRGGLGHWQSATPSLAFHGHVVDLDRPRERLFKTLDDSIRRGVRKAEKAGVRVEFTTARGAMREFYELHCRTRRKHGLPPQPWRFFENLSRHVLEKGGGYVAMARLMGRPLAAAVFLQHGRQLFYKFGASDPAFLRHRPNNLLMWETIERAAEHGLASVHLGRTSLHQEGLRRFKLALGAREERIEYSRYSFADREYVTGTDRAHGWHNRLFRLLPLPVLRWAGNALYSHLS